MFINYGMQIAPSANFEMSCSTTLLPSLEGEKLFWEEGNTTNLPNGVTFLRASVTHTVNKPGEFPGGAEGRAPSLPQALGTISVASSFFSTTFGLRVGQSNGKNSSFGASFLLVDTLS